LIAPLEQQTLGFRIVLTFVLVLVILFALAFIGWMSGGWDMSSGEYTVASADEPLEYNRYDEQLIVLQREALDQAYRDKIAQLFSVWLRDPTGQPERAVTGARQARKAYIDVMKAIEKHERDIQTLKALNPAH